MTSGMNNATRVITFCSGKGGVGKSFLAANIAWELAKAHKILVWDADLGLPNQHLILGVEPPVRISDYYKGNVNLNQVIFKYKEQFHLLAGLPYSMHEETQLSSKNLELFEELIADHNYDYILIDTASGANNQALQCCNFADIIALVLTDEPTSLIDAYGLLKLLTEFIDRSYIKLLVNNVIDMEDAEDISEKLNLALGKFLGFGIDKIGFVPYDREIRKSIVRQELYLYACPVCEASMEISKIAETVINIFKEEAVNLDN